MAAVYDFSMTLRGNDDKSQAYPGMNAAANLPVLGFTALGKEHQHYLTDGSVYGTSKKYTDMDLMSEFHRMGAHQQVTLWIPKDTTGLIDALEKGRDSFSFYLRAWNLAKRPSWSMIVLSSFDSYLYGRMKVKSSSEALIVRFSGATVKFQKDRSEKTAPTEDYYPLIAGSARTYYPL